MAEEEGKSWGATGNPTNPYYGTFQGVPNYYHPPPPQPPPHPFVCYPQQVPPPGVPPVISAAPRYCSHGYQTITAGYAVVEGRPLRAERLPCCGLGMGWFLFIAGFFLCGIPWYIGTVVLCCARVDYREKPGYLACSIASFLALLAVTLGATKGAHTW